MSEESYIDKLYCMPIKAVTISKEKIGNDVHEIMVSQSSDYHFSICDSVNGGEWTTIIDIPPSKIETLMRYVVKALDNYKNKK